VKDGRNHGLELRRPFLRLHAKGRARWRPAGVGDEDVDLTEGLQGSRMDRLDAAGEVAGVVVGTAFAPGVDGLRGGFQTIGAAGRQHDVRAFRGERPGDAEAEAAARGQNEGALAAETEIHGMLQTRTGGAGGPAAFRLTLQSRFA
jgi:hypothetical protein